MGILPILAYLILAALPVTLAYLSNKHTGLSLWMELGKGAALVGFAILALQVALSARFRFADRAFGLDAVMQFHKGMAIFAALLLVAHPILICVSFGDFSLLKFGAGKEVNFGKAALVLLWLTIFFALAFRRLHVSYQIWRFLHKGAVVVVILGFTHGLLMADDFAAKGVTICAWSVVVAVAGLFLYRNLIVPMWGRQRFRVLSVEPQTHNTWTLTFQPERGGITPYRPGQFMFLQLRRKGFRAEQHPFTISSSPTREGVITATIKESGNYTKTIGQTAAQDTALIEAPFGRFSFVHHDAKQFLFIAGGVGITPIVSMLRFLGDMGDERPVLLLYGSHAKRDIIFREELDKMPRHVNVVYLLSDPGEGGQGLRGHVTAQVIKENAGDGLSQSNVYVCGPPPMMKAVLKALRTLSVSPRRIHYERFSI
jgi:predicted ferric reductase